MKTWILDKLKKLKAHLLKSHKSKTMWFNTIIGAAMAALPVAQENFSQLQGLIPDNIYKHAMVALIVGNIILRGLTTKPLADK